MRDPVVALDGNSYEREAILRWIVIHSTSPLTRLPLDTTLIPNNNLKRIIEEWEAGNSPLIAVPQPVGNSIVVPAIAVGHEECYRRFINGKLIYKPNPNNDEGRIEMPFAALTNPLEGTFDLSRCGNAGRYISIATGYRRQKKDENKLEIWIAPRFLIERNIERYDTHMRSVMNDWTASNAPIGIFWTWDLWDLGEPCDYFIADTVGVSVCCIGGLWMQRYANIPSAHGRWPACSWEKDNPFCISFES